MPPEILVVIIFACLLLFLALGVPVAFSLFGVSLVLLLYLKGADMLTLAYVVSFRYMLTDILIALPLFVLMASVLEFSGIVGNLYDAAYKWFGPLRGGLAIGTIVIAAQIDAMSGLGATATITLGVLALPQMLKRGYSKDIALGCIPAGGSLGPVIPPSIIMIILGSLTMLSVGKLFIAGVLPGLLITALWVIFIAVRAALKPSIAPALPAEERVSLGTKLVSLRSTILPIFLVLLVLGTIYAGIATPTEAGGMGAVGAIICAAINRQLSWRAMRQALFLTTQIVGMVMWLLLGGATFASVMQISGLGDVIRDTLLATTESAMVLVILMLVVGIFLGCFMDAGANMMITVPVFWPIVQSLPIDQLWWGLLFTLTLCVGYITPPFGMNLFYLKGVAPTEYNVTLGEIYRAAIPFSLIYILGIAIVFAFPPIALWLPGMMLK